MNSTKLFIIVNTVNTPLNREYDFGIHAAGCADLKRGDNTMCRQYEHEAATAQDVVNAEVEALAEDFGDEDASGFAFRIFPCAHQA